mmetsp:Transcript_12502/g.20230  ORF Transcript_12502/g.20230 Transcript_12502/m.20230 type:complete len:210 (-) Transcript_12502:64-693(-)
MAAADLTCPICLEIPETPTRLAPCGHLFCGDCLAAAFANGNRACPMCRCTAEKAELDLSAERSINLTKDACEGCQEYIVLRELGRHKAGCAAFQAMEADAKKKTERRGQPQVTNRSTFRCPFPGCEGNHMDCTDLIRHFDLVHPGQTFDGVCPICLSMPWGNPNYISRNLVGHIKLRHKFEYNEYVDYQESSNEAAVLQAVLAQSMMES